MNDGRGFSDGGEDGLKRPLTALVITDIDSFGLLSTQSHFLL